MAAAPLRPATMGGEQDQQPCLSAPLSGCRLLPDVGSIQGRSPPDRWAIRSGVAAGFASRRHPQADQLACPPQDNGRPTASKRRVGSAAGQPACLASRDHAGACSPLALRSCPYGWVCGQASPRAIALTQAPKSAPCAMACSGAMPATCCPKSLPPPGATSSASAGTAAPTISPTVSAATPTTRLIIAHSLLRSWGRSGPRHQS